MQILITIIVFVVLLILVALCYWIDEEFPFFFDGIFTIFFIVGMLVALFVIVYQIVGTFM